MRKIFAVLGAAVLAVGLAGCGSNESGDAGTEVPTSSLGSIRAFNVDLNDGRTVVCVVYAAGNKSGLSCDWEGLANGTASSDDS